MHNQAIVDFALNKEGGRRLNWKQAILKKHYVLVCGQNII